MVKRLKSARLPGYDVGNYHCLILTPTEIPGCFRRLGYVDFDGPADRIRRGGHVDDNLLPDCCELLDEQFRSNDVPQHLFESVDDEFMYTIELA
jgi:hypothetical protein